MNRCCTPRLRARWEDHAKGSRLRVEVDESCWCRVPTVDGVAEIDSVTPNGEGVNEATS